MHKKWKNTNTKRTFFKKKNEIIFKENAIKNFGNSVNLKDYAAKRNYQTRRQWTEQSVQVVKKS